MGESDRSGHRNFIHEIIDADLASGRRRSVATRFPPEPNGYLHIGHAKSICLNFGLAAEYGGTCNLRFDDTNPSTEDEEYVRSIIEDVRWLGFEPTRILYASDYFERMYAWAEQLVMAGKAYVDDATEQEISAARGNFYKPGVESPCRGRSPEENLDLLRRMRAGEFPDGSRVLRARIDMKSPNMNLRDPIMYRIKRAAHHRTGNAWCIYPMYDWAHGLEDAIEGITHSICTLEFEDHRPLYDWFLRELGIPDPPQQIEFARLSLNYTVMSKRLLLALVQEGRVRGWDDPRMPTISGLRRRGYTPESIRAFCERVGVAKRDNVADVAMLEHAVREDLNERAPRYMGVLRPLRLVIENFPEGRVEWLDVPNHPERPEMGSRRVPFARTLLVERDDYLDEPPHGWHRLAPGREVRLRYACLLTCREAIRDASGRIEELRCEWDPGSRGGVSPDGRKVRGTLHWVSEEHAIAAEVRLYDRLFSVENPLEGGEGSDFREHLNPTSLETLSGCRLEPALAGAEVGDGFQLERLGYFCVDPDSRPGAPILNRTVPLRDTWARIVASRREGAK